MDFYAVRGYVHVTVSVHRDKGEADDAETVLPRLLGTRLLPHRG